MFSSHDVSSTDDLGVTSERLVAPGIAFDTFQVLGKCQQPMRSLA